MRMIFFLILTAAANTFAAKSMKSEMSDYNYVCSHITKAEALVFKTSPPQKIWRTGLDQQGQIKRKNAFELSKIKINAENIDKEGQVASFKANLAKDYEIKGIFAKDTDGDLPLTVISSYLPDGKASQIKDQYNCSVEKTDLKFQLGSLNE